MEELGKIAPIKIHNTRTKKKIVKTRLDDADFEAVKKYASLNGISFGGALRELIQLALSFSKKE